MGSRYLDFEKWRVRRSSLTTVKMHEYSEPFRVGGPTLFVEFRTFARGLGYTGGKWTLHRWWRRSEESAVMQMLESIGLDSLDVRRSSKSEQARAHGEAATPSEVASPPLEFEASFEALIVMLCRWASTGLHEKRANAEAMLFDLVSFVMGLEIADIKGMMDPPSAREAPACEAEACGGPAPAQCRHCARVISIVGVPSHLAVAAGLWQVAVSLLIELARQQAACPRLHMWYSKVVRAIGSALADKVIGGDVGCEDPSGLRVPRGRKRALRIDPEVRKVAVVDVVSQKRARNSSWAARSGIVPVSPSTARKMPLSYMADYFWTSYRITHKLVQVYISMDASGFAGEDTMCLAWWAHGKGIGGWLLPQVLIGIFFSRTYWVIFVGCCTGGRCTCTVCWCRGRWPGKCDTFATSGLHHFVVHAHRVHLSVSMRALIARCWPRWRALSRLALGRRATLSRIVS